MVDVLAAAVEDTRELDFGVGENPLDLSMLTTLQIVDAANRALPPETLEDLVAPTALQMGEYISAKRDDFTVAVHPGEYAKAMLQELPMLMSDADIYTSLLEQEAKPRIREAISADENVSRWGPHLFGSTEVAVERLTQATMSILTPEWAQSQADTALQEVTPYLLGQSDNFEIRILFTDAQVETSLEEAKAILQESGIYDRLFEREIEPQIRASVYEAIAASPEVPRWIQSLFGTNEAAADRLVQAANRIVTGQWMQSQAESALEEVTPFLTGRADEFLLRIRLSDTQANAAIEEVKSILRETDAYDLLYVDVIGPVVREDLGSTVILPYGVEVTDDEVVGVLREAAPPRWVQQQAEMLIDNVSPYLMGRSADFLVVVSLVDNKRRAEGALVEVVGAALARRVSALPVCRTRTEAISASLSWASLPACLPPGVSVADVTRQPRNDVVAAVRPLILSPVPNQIRFTDSDLRAGLVQTGAVEAVGLLDDGRKLLAEGWTYDDVDLRAYLGDRADTLDQLRDLFRDGYTYTEEDLRAELVKRSEYAVRVLDDVRSLLADGYVFAHQYVQDARPRNQALRDLDDVHSLSMAVRRYGWIVYVCVPILLLAVGFVGGNTWPARAAWASAFLFISAAATFLVVGPFYDSVFAPGFDQIHANIMAQSSGDFGNTFTLMSGKLRELFGAFRSEFVGGVQQASLAIAAIAAAVSILVLRRFRSRLTWKPQADRS